MVLGGIVLLLSLVVVLVLVLVLLPALSMARDAARDAAEQMRVRTQAQQIAAAVAHAREQGIALPRGSDVQTTLLPFLPPELWDPSIADGVAGQPGFLLIYEGPPADVEWPATVIMNPLVRDQRGFVAFSPTVEPSPRMTDFEPALRMLKRGEVHTPSGEALDPQRIWLPY